MKQELIVFVASPGDCVEERRVVKDVADQVTQALGELLEARVRVIGWEAVSPDIGRPQGHINPLVDQCDIFIGIVGHRWGSPTGEYSSGFLEEYERAKTRRENEDDPQVALFFREVPEAMAQDPGPQLSEVLTFRKRLRDEHAALFRRFDGPADLAPQIWELLSPRLVRASESVGRPSIPQGSTGEQRSGPTSDVEASGPESVDDARRQVAATTDGFTRLALGSEPEQPLDADRLLLIALSLGRDNILVPTHPANRLFRHRDDLVLTEVETTLWLRTLLSDIGSSKNRSGRVIPGWALVSLSEEAIRDLLSDNDTSVAVGVLRTLQRLRVRPRVMWPLEDDIDGAVPVWLRLLANSWTATATVEYLDSVVEADDVPFLDAILSEDGRSDIRELRELLSGDPGPLATSVAASNSVPEWKSARLFGALSEIDADLLRPIAVGRGPLELRRRALEELDARELLGRETIAELLDKPDLVDAVFNRSKDPSSPITDQLIAEAAVDSECDIDVKRRAMASVLTVEELMETFQESPENRHTSWGALAWKAGHELSEKARTVYDTDAHEIIQALESDEAWRSSENLIPFVRGRARLSALQILTAQLPVPEEDRQRVKDEVEHDSPYTTGEALRMMASIANPEDAAYILAHVEDVYGENRTEIIRILLDRVGAPAARQLLEFDQDFELASAADTLGQDPDVNIEAIEELLYSTNDEVRVVALDHLLDRVGQRGAKELLERYPRRTRYYYNVMAELDWVLFAQDSVLVKTG